MSGDCSSPHISQPHYQVLRKPCDGTPKATKATVKITTPTIKVTTCVTIRMARITQAPKKNIPAFLPVMESPRRNNPTKKTTSGLCRSGQFLFLKTARSPSPASTGYPFQGLPESSDAPQPREATHPASRANAQNRKIAHITESHGATMALLHPELLYSPHAKR
jgi:hypothetical protein